MPQQIAAELRIVAEELTADGRSIFAPSARYDCHRCGATEGPVTGRGPVRAFAECVRDVHAGRCPAQATTRTAEPVDAPHTTEERTAMSEQRLTPPRAEVAVARAEAIDRRGGA